MLEKIVQSHTVIKSPLNGASGSQRFSRRASVMRIAIITTLLNASSDPVVSSSQRGCASALAHPRWLELTTGSLLALSSVVMIAILITEARREKRWLPLAPLSGLLITVWLWTIFSSIDPVMRYFIPALHSIQYFYFAFLMKRNEARAFEGEPTFGKPASVRLGFLAVSALMLGWFLFRGMPTALDDLLVGKIKRGQIPDDLGETPYFAAFFVAVSIHHYFMDSVIWRRDNPDPRYFK